jgi:hypothetical protein
MERDKIRATKKIQKRQEEGYRGRTEKREEIGIDMRK